jgi:hypothetical protein
MSSNIGSLLVALAAGVSKAADTRNVSDLKLGHLWSDGMDNTEDLMADTERIFLLTPLAPTGVDVTVADARPRDLDVYCDAWMCSVVA